MWNNVPKLLEPMNSYLLVMVIWWAVMTSSRLRVSSPTVLFGTAFIGYTLQMLPWSVTAYYMGPISYLLGLTLASVLGEPKLVSRSRVVLALSVPVVLALLLTAWPVRQVLQTNAVVNGIGDCLVNERDSSTVMAGSLVYVTSSSEAPIRIMQNLQLRDPQWTGQIRLEDAESTGFQDPSTTHYVVVGPGAPPTGRAVTPVCEAGIATVYRMDS